MPNTSAPGGCLLCINWLGRVALKILVGPWDESANRRSHKYTLFTGGLLVGEMLGILAALMIRYCPIYPIDLIKLQSREMKLFLCFVVIPAAFIILCFALESIWKRIAVGQQ